MVASPKTSHALIGIHTCPTFSDPGSANVSHVLTDARRNFAANVGITFHTPEEFFLQEEPRQFALSFDPTKFLPENTAAEGPSMR